MEYLDPDHVVLNHHLHRQRDWSLRTFGPGQRLRGVLNHICKELDEVRDSNGALDEWIDVVILGFDGALRSGASPEQIVGALLAKQRKNESRKWPDFRTMREDQAIEYIREPKEGEHDAD